MELDDFGRHYLKLALEIEKHVPGYVDAYIGPAGLKAEVNATGQRRPAALLDDLAWLGDHLPGDEPDRRAYLAGCLRAMGCTVRILAGEAIGYLDEVQQLYDIRPEPADESRFVAAASELDTLLPGSGHLAERLEQHRQRFEVANEQALPLLELARQETRRRTLPLVELPEDETLAVKLVSNQPWSAYNWYLGNGRSLIEFNTDIPLSALALAGTFAHEGYPGHHTEHVLKERLLYQERGYAEEAVFLLHSPAAVIAEGIATTAAEIIFPDGGELDWLVAVLLPAAGLPGESADRLRRIQEAGRRLRHVSGNAAILFYTGRLDEAQTLDYIRAFGLTSERRARQSFSFITNPLFRSYPFTYTAGYALIARAAGDGPKAPIFRQLLTSQALPSQLAAG